MRPQVRALLGALPLLCVCVAAQQKPATPPAATISGVLTSADLRQPLRKAQVRLITPGVRTPRVTTTDGDGRYVFTNVAPGTYTLAASRPGYLDMARGARRPGPGAGVPLTVADGQTLDDVSWTLPRAGVITGIVLDEFGDPAFNVPVRAMRIDFSPGHRSITSGGNGVSDDRGMYRIAGLLPGEYFVAAVPRDNVAEASARAEFARDRYAEVIASAKARGVPSNAQAAPPERPSPIGYVATYYPGSPTGAGAATVHVGVSEEVGGIDIRLPIVTTVSVSGRITSADGVIPTSRLQLIDANMPLSLVGIWFHDARADGTFDFHGVVPGSYIVKAFGTPGGPKGAAGGSMWGSVDVGVDDRGAHDVVLTMQRGVTVSGRVAIEDLPAGFNRSQLRVALDPVSGPTDWEMAQIGLAFDATGAFTATNVLPGRYRPNAVGLPDGWSIDTAIFADRDAADHHLTIDGSRNLTGIVKFTSRTGVLSGAVTNAGGAPELHHSVLVFPTDRSLWVPRSRRIHLTQPGADGRYMLRNLPPGEYFVVPLADPEPGRQFDPEFLAQQAAIAVQASVTAGGQRTVDLRVR